MSYLRRLCARFLISLLASAATMTAVLPLTSCGKDGKAGDKRSAGQTALLKALDDSLAANSPHTRDMITRAMNEAEDSMDYYDCYLRMQRYNISLNLPDTSMLDWERPAHFLYNQKQTPRIKGMLAYLYNTKGYYNHKFHYNPHSTIRYYSKACALLDKSDTKDNAPDVCANLGDAYVAVNDMPHAAYWYRRALFLSDSLNLPYDNRLSLNMGLGRIYLNLGDFEAARRCYADTDRNFDRMPLNMKLYFLNNYGNYYYYTKDYAKSLGVFMRLKRLLEAQHMDDSYEMYLCKINMADTYFNLGDTGKARPYLDEAAAFFSKIGDETGTYYANTIKIGMALKRGDNAGVKNILDNEHIKTTIDFNLSNIRQDYMRDYYVRKGDYRNAYLNLKEAVSRNDSLKHNLSRMRTSEIMMRHAQDTMQLHLKLKMQEKDAHIRKARWALAFGLMIIAILVLITVSILIYSRKRRLQTQMQLMNLKLASARNLISPHFIFNVLNNRISENSGTDEKALVNLANLIRANLNLSGRPYVSLKEELDFVRHYVEVLQADSRDNISFTTETPPDSTLRNIMIPSMFIQILVENALKHGLKGRHGDKRLSISVKTGNGRYTVSVTDNGTGFDIRHRNNNSTGTGLKVIRSTISILNRMNKRKMRLSIRNLHDPQGRITGCEATFESYEYPPLPSKREGDVAPTRPY